METRVNNRSRQLGQLPTLFVGLAVMLGSIFFLAQQACPEPWLIYVGVFISCAGLAMVFSTMGKASQNDIDDSKKETPFTRGLRLTGAIVIMTVLWPIFSNRLVESTDFFKSCNDGPVSLRGKVIDATSGHPLSDVRVVVSGLSLGGNLKPCQTDGDGDFLMQLPVGDGQAEPVLTLDFEKIRFIPYQTQLLADSMRKAKSTFLRVTLQPVPPRAFRFAGRVLSRQTGDGLAGVHIFSEDGTYRTKTNEDGIFNLKLEAKSQGFVRLNFQKTGFKPYTEDFDLPDDVTEPYNKNDIRIILNLLNS